MAQVGQALDLELGDKSQLQLCPFTSLSLPHLACRTQTTVINALIAPGALRRARAPV